MWVYVWLAITALALIVEFATVEIVSVWFGCGGLVALLFALLGVPWYVQIPIFIVVSFASIFLLRRFVLKKINNVQENLNADSAIGKDFKLIKGISFENAGEIKVNDVIWSAVTEDGKKEIAKDTIVKVVNLKGNKYIVEETK